MSGPFARRLIVAAVLISCAAGLFPRRLQAEHPISIIEADVYVNRYKLTMRLKCFADDLELLHGLEPYEDGFYDNDEIQATIREHGNYLASRIRVLSADGQQLQAKVTEVVPFEIPEEGLMSGQLMNYFLGYVLEYSYEQPPEFLTFQQEIVDENFLFPSELKMLLKQAGSDTPYAAALRPGQTEIVRFDWDRPPLSQDASQKEWEEWFEEQREQTLGITSYSSVYSFIYVRDHDVRHEVLIPLATLATMVDFQRADEAYLDVAEQDAAKQVIERLLSVGNPVKIDQLLVKPLFDRIDFYGLDIRDFAVQAERRKVSMANGRVGVIMSYPTKGAPSEVSVSWDKFSSSLTNVDSVVFAYDQIEKTQFSRFLDNNTYTWHNPGTPPLPDITHVTSTLKQPPSRSSTVSFVCFALAGLLVVAAVIRALARRNRRAALRLASGFGVASAVLAIVGFLAWQPLEPPRLEDGIAKSVFQQLHKNMFRAFDYRAESDVYDALATSVDGQLLRDLYLQIRKSLEVREQGGAVSRIEEVQLVDDQLVSPGNGHDAPAPGFAVECKWNLVGSIEHWGHIHQRTNRYDAVFLVELRDDAWKITEMDMLDEQQGQVKSSLRKF